tara:strand:+ start:1880 stop:2113 length:234 start_codon:yes stop_codon:yes gene_type:complete
MALFSYVFPSGSITGSVIGSRVIGHRGIVKFTWADIIVLYCCYLVLFVYPLIKKFILFQFLLFMYASLIYATVTVLN